MSGVVVIPARGGSKRIPLKNQKDFCGKPIIAYSIEAALAASHVDRVVVSTDSEQIAQLARELGAEVPFMRPAELANDTAATLPVIQHAISALDSEPDYVCCLYATAPFITSQRLDDAFAQLIASTKEYAFGVCHYDFPVQRALKPDAGGVSPLFPEFIQSRSQDLQEAWHDAGQFYWGRAQAFLNLLPVFAPHSLPIHLPRWAVLDIDTPEDWRQAEIMYRLAQDDFSPKPL